MAKDTNLKRDTLRRTPIFVASAPTSVHRVVVIQYTISVYTVYTCIYTERLVWLYAKDTCQDSLYPLETAGRLVRLGDPFTSACLLNPHVPFVYLIRLSVIWVYCILYTVYIQYTGYTVCPSGYTVYPHPYRCITNYELAAVGKTPPLRYIQQFQHLEVALPSRRLLNNAPCT